MLDCSHALSASSSILLHNDKIILAVFYFTIVLIYLFLFLAVLHSMWDLSFPTRDKVCAPCSGSKGSWPLDHQGNPTIVFIDVTLPFDLFLFIITMIDSVSEGKERQQRHVIYWIWHTELKIIQTLSLSLLIREKNGHR